MNKVTHYVQHDFNKGESETNKIIKMSKSFSKITFNISDLPFPPVNLFISNYLHEGNYNN